MLAVSDVLTPTGPVIARTSANVHFTRYPCVLPIVSNVPGAHLRTFSEKIEPWYKARGSIDSVVSY